MPELLKIVTPGEARARFAAAYTPRPRGTERIPLRQAHRRVLARDIIALEDLPEFDKSTVDGYAVRAEDLSAASQALPVSLAVVGEVQMGEAPHFTIGPGTAAIMSTPRYIRKRNTVVVGYLYRITRIYAVGSLLTLIFGLIITQLLHDFSKPWVSASITLFVVAAVLLILIMNDQRKALTALAAAEGAADARVRSDDSDEGTKGDGTAAGGDQPPATAAADLKIAAVERGRIASMSGIIALIWLAILVLMVWNG